MIMTIKFMELHMGKLMLNHLIGNNRAEFGTVSLFFLVYFIILRGIVLYSEPGYFFLRILKKLILGNSP